MTALAVSIGYAAAFAVVLGMGEQHGGFGWEAASMGLTLAFPLLLVVLTAHAIAGQVRGNRVTALPVLALLAGVPGIGWVRTADGELHDRRFAGHLRELEAMLARAPVESGGRMLLPADSLPSSLRRCCARVVFVRRDGDGRLSATIVGQRRTSYLYDPTGERLHRGINSGRWRSTAPLAPDWYRVVRF